MQQIVLGILEKARFDQKLPPSGFGKGSKARPKPTIFDGENAMLRQVQPASAHPIDFDFLLRLHKTDDSDVGLVDCELDSDATKRRTDVQRENSDSPKESKMGQSTLSPASHGDSGLSASLLIKNIAFAASVAMATAIIAYLAGFVSQTSAGMFLLGSWSACFLAMYTVVHQVATVQSFNT